MWRYYVLLLTLIISQSVSAGDLARIYICPGDLTIIQGAQHQFQVFGLDAEGNEVSVNTEAVHWMATQSSGTITPTGLFTAGTTNGIFKVTAGYPNLYTAMAMVKVVSPEPKGNLLFEKSWGGSGYGHLLYPDGIAVASNGDIFVADTYNHRIHIFNPEGIAKACWGLRGSADGQFDRPRGIAFGSNGNLYVVDGRNNRIQVLDSSGGFVAKWGSEGQADGQFYLPWDIAVDGQGNVYVADTFNNRIQKFSATGTFIAKWGKNGTANGDFRSPGSVAVDSSGNVYVADCGNSRIQKFSSSGAFITKWGNYGSNPGQFLDLYAVDVDTSGYVYATDSRNSCIQKFSSTGTFIARYQLQKSPVEDMAQPGGISVTATGDIMVTELNENSVRKLDSTGAPVRSLGLAYQQKGQFHRVSSVAADRWGNIHTVEDSGRVQSFDSAGKCTGCWGSYGTGNSQFRMPDDIAIGSDNCVYITDMMNYCVKKFDLFGGYITKWGSYGTGPGQFQLPRSLGLDAQNNVYVIDYFGHSIQKFNSSGHYLGTWYPSTSTYSTGICVLPDGTHYVSDSYDRIVRIYDQNGSYISAIHNYESESWPLCGPLCLDMDKQGNLYVGDSGNWVKVFSHAGDFTYYFDGYGIGEFDSIYDLEFDVCGNLYVADYRNSRVNRFVPIDSALGLNKYRRDGELIALAGQVVTAGSDELGDCFYIESDDRSSGIKITGKSATRGSKVSVTGIISTVNGERVIKANSVTSTGTGTITPILLNNKALGGADIRLQGQPETGQQGVENGTGANNVGLLVKTYGRMTYSDTGFFYIDDGSGLDDGSGHTGIRVQTNGFSSPFTGFYVQVTGISTTYTTDSGLQRLIRTRTAEDVVILSATISGSITYGGGGVIPTLVESTHPYPNNSNYTWTISGPTTSTRIRVHFSTLELEYNHDYLYLLNGAGVQQVKYNTSKMFTDFWSQWVSGNTIKLRLTSDSANSLYGFQVDAYEVEGTTFPVQGVTITLSPSNMTTQTDSNGNFSFAVPNAGTYTLTPSLTGASFTPTSKTITVTAGQVVTGVDFTKN